MVKLADEMEHLALAYVAAMSDQGHNLTPPEFASYMAMDAEQRMYEVSSLAEGFARAFKRLARSGSPPTELEVLVGRRWVHEAGAVPCSTNVATVRRIDNHPVPPHRGRTGPDLASWLLLV